MPLILKGLAGQVRRIQKQLKAHDTLRQRIARNVAEAAVDLVKDAAAHEQDPVGNDWARLKLREGKIGRNTGGMLQSLHISATGHGGFTLAFSKDYAVYFHGGTGIYGPSKQRIRPKTAKALAFSVRGAAGQTGKKKGKGTKKFVFASVAGQPPRPLFPEGPPPLRWRREMIASAQEVVKKHFGK